MKAKPNGGGWWRLSMGGPADGPGATGSRIMAVAVISAVAALSVAAGCGPDVSMDESTIGSNGVPGDDGSLTSSTFRLGEGVTLPEGLPAIGIPSYARITKAIGSQETGNFHVIYYSKTPIEDVMQRHLDALAALGYTASGSLTSPHEGEVIMTIGAEDQTAWSHALIRGGGKSGSDNGYWVQINPGAGGRLVMGTRARPSGRPIRGSTGSM